MGVGLLKAHLEAFDAIGTVARHERRYGSPRVRLELRELHGKRVSRKRVGLCPIM